MKIKNILLYIILNRITKKVPISILILAFIFIITAPYIINFITNF